MNKLKVGVVGLGGIGTISLKYYLQNPLVEVAAICDVREERVKELCDTMNIAKGYTHVEDMLRLCPELDMVSIHNVDSAHVSTTLSALNAGKHVFVEKPMGLNIDECHQVASLARHAGKKVAVGQVVRFRNYVKTVKELISLGTLGTIYNIEIEYMTDQMRFPGMSDRAKQSYSPGVVTLGVHAIDTVRWLVGEIVEVKAVSNKGLSDPECGFDDMTLAIFRFDNDCVGRLSTCWSSVGENDPYMGLRVFGSKGTVIGNRLMLQGVRGSMTLPEVTDNIDILKQELESVVDSIIHDKPLFCDAADGGNTAIVCLSILDAVRTNTNVRVNNIIRLA
ncbi:hypothetical protein Back11_62930 [Paenibacillus baekrokdamisoli]|uniref:Oxidoreductase n=1 Tax=Paenibacillus baekrokdamisoli TaxID=1712516 RepID=A0A3G9JLA1_9BACL|nr:Gfo/Idh/MocA family oxidoreductase [Paenibacillus baekrokdamisoli]MBB3069478.1 putative dehydrogenase [Paenibacillus baekrokdamisoli]BBH24948.1 hypothetical protein Back11_62930 [Paenibacillus baekrokdamisoli]